MKDFAKSVRTNNADLGIRPVVPQLVKDIAKIYEDNGKDREKTKQELIQKHHMSERQAEEVLRQIVGNSKVDNAYKWEKMHGHLELYNPAVPFGGHSRGFVEKTKTGYIGAKANGSIVISKKEFATEEEAKKYVENKKVGNSSKFDALESIIQEASMYAENAYRRLSSPYSATNIISDLSHCKQACDIAIKRAQEYDKELQSKK